MESRKSAAGTGITSRIKAPSMKTVAAASKAVSRSTVAKPRSTLAPKPVTTSSTAKSRASLTPRTTLTSAPAKSSRPLSRGLTKDKNVGATKKTVNEVLDFPDLDNIDLAGISDDEDGSEINETDKRRMTDFTSKYIEFLREEFPKVERVPAKVSPSKLSAKDFSQCEILGKFLDESAMDSFVSSISDESAKELQQRLSKIQDGNSELRGYCVRLIKQKEDRESEKKQEEETLKFVEITTKKVVVTLETAEKEVKFKPEAKKAMGDLKKTKSLLKERHSNMGEIYADGWKKFLELSKELYKVSAKNIKISKARQELNLAVKLEKIVQKNVAGDEPADCSQQENAKETLRNCVMLLKERPLLRKQLIDTRYRIASAKEKGGNFQLAITYLTDKRADLNDCTLNLLSKSPKTEFMVSMAKKNILANNNLEDLADVATVQIASINRKISEVKADNNLLLQQARDFKAALDELRA